MQAIEFRLPVSVKYFDASGAQTVSGFVDRVEMNRGMLMIRSKSFTYKIPIADTASLEIESYSEESDQ